MIRKNSLILFTVFFVLLPLISVSRLSVPFEGAKAILLYLFVILSLRLKITKAHKLLIIFFLWAVFASISGVDYFKSIVGNYYRYDGLVTLAFFMLFSLIATSVFYKQFIRPVSIAISFGVFLAVILYLLAHGTFGNTNFLAGYLLVSTPFIIFRVGEKS